MEHRIIRDVPFHRGRRAVPFPPKKKKFKELAYYPRKWCNLVHFSKNLDFHVEELSTEVGWGWGKTDEGLSTANSGCRYICTLVGAV